MGFVLAAGAIRVSAAFSPLVAEALAISQGIRFARDCGLTPIHVEFDSQSLINLLLDRSIPQSDVGTITSNILHSENLSFIANFSFVHRLANKVADALVKEAVNLISDLFWFESCPHVWWIWSRMFFLYSLFRFADFNIFLFLSKNKKYAVLSYTIK
ncbi:hypothetical protein ACOSQ2_016627 [Xanthoceras sorbifolium]